jgi:dsRNA-specific ribonuclease
MESTASGHATRKAAEIAASADMLTRLEQAGLLKAPSAAKPALARAISSNHNVISLLQEWTQGRKLPLPECRQSLAADEAGLFRCTVSVKSVIGVFEGSGRTKQEAKHAAAQTAWTEMLDRKLL